MSQRAAAGRRAAASVMRRLVVRPQARGSTRPVMNQIMRTGMIVMERTAIGPQSLLSRKSNIVTEIVLVRAVNSRIVAESSRIEPMKIKIQVAITPLRMSGVVMSKSARSRVAPRMRLASSSSGCTARNELAICW